MTLGFDGAVLVSDPRRRSLLLDVLGAAVDAADPGAAVSRSLARTAGGVIAGDHSIAVPRGRVTLLAVGKAAAAMAGSAVATLAGLAVSGVVVTPTGEAPPGLLGVRGSHPVPDHHSMDAGTALLQAAGRDTDLVLCLISGGGSALAEVPAPGLGLDDLAATTVALLRSGAPITEVNTVRRHLSALKGGRLARAASAPVVSLVVSDVVGDHLEAIAGGPTVADPTMPRDALEIIETRHVPVPAAVLRHLRTAGPPAAMSGAGGRPVAVIVAGGSAAAKAAASAAVRQGVPARVGGTDVEGEAREVGNRLGLQALGGPTGMTVLAGETTVTVRGDGRGGRNQEVALAAARVLDGHRSGLVCSFATDGVDGPTDAAGAIGDGGTLARGRAAGLDAADSLERNDALRYLEATGDLLLCGPTGTNVGDLLIAWRW